MKTLKKLSAALVALALACPTVFSVSADTDSFSFDESTGTLTISGPITREELRNYPYYNVKHVVAVDGAKFTGGYWEDAFYNWDSAESIDLSKADFSEVEDMYEFISDCDNLKEINMAGANTVNCTYMEDLFSACYQLEKVNVEGMDVSKNTTCDDMFEFCYAIKEIDLSSWDLSNCYDYSYMFYECYALEKVIFPESVEINSEEDYVDLYKMFYSTESIIEIDLSGFSWNEEAEVDNYSTFYESGVRVLTLPENFPVLGRMELYNKNDNYIGWIKAGSEEGDIISGDGDYAAFDLGAGTYYHARETVKTEGTPATCEEDGVQDYYKLANPMRDPEFPDGVVPEGYVSEKNKLFYDEYAVYEVEDVNEDGVVDEKDLVIPATDHDWGEWEVVTEATTEADGLKRRVCKNDPTHVEEEVIPKLDPEESASESETESETESDSETESAADSAADSSKADSSSKASSSEAAKTASTTTTTNPGTGAATAAFGLTAALAAAVVVTKKRNK